MTSKFYIKFDVNEKGYIFCNKSVDKRRIPTKFESCHNNNRMYLFLYYVIFFSLFSKTSNFELFTKAIILYKLKMLISLTKFNLDLSIEETHINYVLSNTLIKNSDVANT